MMMNETNQGRETGPRAVAYAQRWVAGFIAAICSMALAMAGMIALFPASAAWADDTAKGSITVDYHNDGTALTGADVYLYHVANWDFNTGSGFTPTEKFKDYKKSFDWKSEDVTAEQFRNLAQALAGYISRDGIKADSVGEIGAAGTVTFGGLSQGLYLIRIGSYSYGNLSCGESLSLVSLPSSTEDGKKTTMDPTIYAKNDCTPNTTPPEETVTKKVHKVWKGDTEAARPKSVTVQLICDGKVYDTVELNAANNWTHEWTNLEPGHEWYTVEKTVPDHYTVLVDREGDVNTITNTYTPPDTPPETPPTTPPTNTPPKTPPTANTGAGVTIPVACTAVFASLGLMLLMHRRRKRAEQGE